MTNQHLSTTATVIHHTGETVEHEVFPDVTIITTPVYTQTFINGWSVSNFSPLNKYASRCRIKIKPGLFTDDQIMKAGFNSSREMMSLNDEGFVVINIYDEESDPEVAPILISSEVCESSMKYAAEFINYLCEGPEYDDHNFIFLINSKPNLIETTKEYTSYVLRYFGIDESMLVNDNDGLL